MTCTRLPLLLAVTMLGSCSSSNETSDNAAARTGGSTAPASSGENSAKGDAGTGGTVAASGGTTGTGVGGASVVGGKIRSGWTTGTGGGAALGGKTDTRGAPTNGGSVVGGISAEESTLAHGGIGATGGSKPIGGSSAGGGNGGGASSFGGARVAGTPTAGGSTATGSTTSVPCPSSSICIDFTATLQEIDGLGASSAGHGVLSSAVLDASFKNDTLKQMGLSIIRVEIDAAGQSAWDQQKTNASNAKSRGARYVMATPWSPPASMKTNGSAIGGELKTSSYADYAVYLRNFYTFMGGAGAVDVISVQNEPNITVTYTSCHWNATQLFNFVKNDAGAVGVPLMIPEVSYFDTSYSDPVLNDATAAANISHIGMHLYGGQLRPYTLALQRQKKIWMTEHLFDPEDTGTTMAMAKEIMDCFDTQMNGYVWWYLALPKCNLVDSSGSLTNKGYVMGQFSKYIRPGAHRVAATYQPKTNVNIQAFTGTNNAIVALNRNTSAVTLDITVTKGNFANAQKFTTSSTKKLSDGGPVSVTNGTFTATLDAQSVTTFVSAQ